MAIAYFELKLVSRGNATQNRNCVGAAAYNSREKIYSTDNGHTYNYSRKASDIENKNVLLPPNAPQEYKNRQKLWQAVEKAETSNKAQLARKIILALPWDVTAEERKELVENFCKTAFVKEGMCVDYAIHKPDKGNKNYHVHIMITMRGIDEKGQWQSKCISRYKLDSNGNKIPLLNPDGTQKRDKKNGLRWKCETIKTNDWDNPKNLEKWRNLAEQEINKYLPKEKQISMKSYERQGLDKLAQVHRGYSAIDRKTEMNRITATLNNEKDLIKQYTKEIDELERIIEEQQKKEASKTVSDGRKDTGTMSDTPEKQNNLQSQQQPKELPEQKTVTAHEQQPDKWEQRKQYYSVTEELKKLEEKKQKLMEDAEKAGKNKRFWQKEEVVINCYLLEHGYKNLMLKIKEQKKQQAELEKQIWGERRQTAELPEQKTEARIKLEEQKKQIEKQIEQQQKQEQPKTEIEKAKTTLENLKQQKPKAKLVKSEWQKQRDKERENSRGRSR